MHHLGCREAFSFLSFSRRAAKHLPLGLTAGGASLGWTAKACGERFRVFMTQPLFSLCPLAPLASGGERRGMFARGGAIAQCGSRA